VPSAIGLRMYPEFVVLYTVTVWAADSPCKVGRATLKSQLVELQVEVYRSTVRLVHVQLQ
jgi:hypothetical protein